MKTPLKPQRHPPVSGPSDIPIVHSLYDTYATWNKVLEKFPKSQRYTLGETISRNLLTTLEIILAASGLSNPIEKLARLREASAKIDALKLLVRLTKDCQCVTNNQYFDFESRLRDIGKMTGGWINSFRREETPE